MTTAVSTSAAFTATTAPSSPALPAPSPDVVFRAMPDGGVLFAPATEVYFGLNTTGAFVWEHLAPTCATLDELCAAVLARYPDAPAELVRRDVEAIVAELVTNRLAVHA